MKLSKYGILAKKYLEEYKPFKFQQLTMNGTIMYYLLEFEHHLNGYANLIEIELKQKYPMTDDKDSFMGQVKYLNMIQEMVDEFVKSEIMKIV